MLNNPFGEEHKQVKNEGNGSLVFTLDPKKLNMGKRITSSGISKKFLKRSAGETQRFGEKRPYLKKRDSCKLQAQKSTSSNMSVDPISNSNFALPSGAEGAVSQENNSADQLQ